MYSKFGFCKFKSMCKIKHYTEECNKQNCQEKNTCQKRHPKKCKRYSLGKCRFKNYCAFKHPSSNVVRDQCEIEQSDIESFLECAKDLQISGLCSEIEEDVFTTIEKTKISNINFNYMDIREAIDQLSVNASAGPDGVPAIFLKKARETLVNPSLYSGTNL